MTEDELLALPTALKSDVRALVERCRRLRAALVKAHKHIDPTMTVEWQVREALDRDAADVPLGDEP